MTEQEISDHLETMSRRHKALGGNGLALVLDDGRWAVTSSGGVPRVHGAGKSALAAFYAAETRMDSLEHEATQLAKTLGVSA